jgi:hypothetical protein
MQRKTGKICFIDCLDIRNSGVQFHDTFHLFKANYHKMRVHSKCNWVLFSKDEGERWNAAVCGRNLQERYFKK